MDSVLGGLVRALFAALLPVHYRLEECAEDGRRYARPVKIAGLDEQAAHGGVKIRHTQGIAEAIAVHIKGRIWGKGLRSSSRVVVRLFSSVLSVWKIRVSQGPKSEPSSRVRSSRKPRKRSRGSKMPVSSAKRQKTIRTRTVPDLALHTRYPQVHYAIFRLALRRECLPDPGL